MHRVSAQIYLRATVQDGVLRIHPQLLFFAAKVQIWPLFSSSRWRLSFSGLNNQLLIFYGQDTNMWICKYGKYNSRTVQDDKFRLPIVFKHMNRPLHLYMLELFTPYLFQDSYRRRTDQEHPSAKERSSVLKTLKTIGTMYIYSLRSQL